MKKNIFTWFFKHFLFILTNLLLVSLRLLPQVQVHSGATLWLGFVNFGTGVSRKVVLMACLFTLTWSKLFKIKATRQACYWRDCVGNTCTFIYEQCYVLHSSAFPCESWHFSVCDRWQYKKLSLVVYGNLYLSCGTIFMSLCCIKCKTWQQSRLHKHLTEIG